jgi:hypothetical protein
MNKICQNCHSSFLATRKSAMYCGGVCRVAAHRSKQLPPPKAIWLGKTTALTSERLDLAYMAASIIEGYMGRVTLRQVYYRMVAANVIPNTNESYKKLGSLIKIARENGIIEWGDVEDRGRKIESPATYGSMREFRRVMRLVYDEDRWTNQQHKIAVIVEKAALAGVIEPICRKWQVPFVASRGYASSTLMAEASIKLGGRIIHYYGDHDPSGTDMSRDWQDRLRDFGAGSVIDRVGLSRDQVELYDLPPQAVKETDARATKYSIEHGKGVWELDAMPPDALERLVETNILAYVDLEAWGMRDAEIEANRQLL